MNSVRSNAGVVVTRVARTQWHALEADQVVGRAETSRRPDGRLFLSADAWHSAVFDQLAHAMLTALPKPLYTVVDEDDHDLTAGWTRAGLTTRRREWEYLVPTNVAEPRPPSGVTIIGLGAAEEAPLTALDRVVRDEVAATVGWHDMPAEVLPHQNDPSKYAVAAVAGEYVGLVRVTSRPQLPRIGLIAVRADHQRRGIGRALLVSVLDSLRRRGTETATAEVTESNTAATALFDGVGARRASSNLELVFA